MKFVSSIRVLSFVLVTASVASATWLATFRHC